MALAQTQNDYGWTDPTDPFGWSTSTPDPSAPAAPNQTWTFAGYRWPDNMKIFKDNTGAYGTAEDGATFSPLSGFDPSTLHPQAAAGQAATSPSAGTDNAALWEASGKNPEQFVKAYIAQKGLKGAQTDPAALNDIVTALKGLGVNAVLDTRSDQYHKGIMLDGNFVKMLDGSNNWIWDTGGGGDSKPSAAPPADLNGQLGSLLAPYPQTFQAPAAAGLPAVPTRTGDSTPPPVPTRTADSTPPPVPDYPAFTAPTADTVLSDPGFQFRMSQGQKALESAAAAKGILRTGGTLKDLINYGQQFASNEYQNVFDRGLSTYQTNRDTALGQYGLQSARANTLFGQDQTLYGNAADRANTVFGQDQTLFGDQRANATDTYNRAYDQFKTDWNMWNTQNQNVFDRLKWQTELGQTSASA